MFKKIIFMLIVSMMLSTAIYAKCNFKNKVPVKSFTAAFEAWKVVTSAMKECGNFEAELDQEFKIKQPDAFAVNPSLYQIGGVANATLVPLLEAGTIRPLDDLVAKYGKHLKPNQLIKKNGKIMAVAMMVNAQHFMYRGDIFKKLNIKEPKTYKQVLAAAKRIQKSGLVEYPLGGTYKTGWNLGEEFINMYLGFGGSLTDSDNQPTLNNKDGAQALIMMKKLSKYMDPEYLVSDSTYVQKQFQQGKIAMANLWSSRANAMNDEAESQVVGKVVMSVAPIAKKGQKPASTLWWDGIVIAKNISDKEADAAFRVAMEGIDKQMVKENNDVAVWLIDGFKPSPLAKGAIATANAGAPSYPGSKIGSMVHTAAGNNIADYLTGKKSARKTLKAIEADYLVAAKESGLVK